MPAKKKRLPKAPLTEVVFEFRWNLQSGPDNQPVLRSDPGLLPLIDAFTKAAKKQKFGTFKDLSHPMQTGAYGVVRRFYKSEGKPFPLLQIGPGIFASNESTEYDWVSFKKQTVSGLTAAIESYPKLDFFSWRPAYIELRYIDVFDKKLFGEAALFDFTKKVTSLNFGLPKMLEDQSIFTGDGAGRFLFTRDLKNWKGSKFSLDLGSAKHDETKDDVIRLETKVASEQAGVPAFTTKSKFIKEVGDWLEFAHNITSPFFKEFILPDAMKKLGA